MHVRRLGRELPRLITDLSNLEINEARDVARRLMYEPQSFADGFGGVSDLMDTPVAKEVYLGRISPELEAKLRFLFTRVSPPRSLKNSIASFSGILAHLFYYNQVHTRHAEARKYNIEWLKRRFFGKPDHMSAVVDIVRYIVTSIHPPNKIIASEIVQRWQVVTYVLLLADNVYLLGALRNALLWDFIAFDRATDNVMFVEPAILTMFQNKDNYSMVLVKPIMDHLAVIISLWPERIANVRVALSSVVAGGVGKSLLDYKDLVSLKDHLSSEDSERWLSWLPSEKTTREDKFQTYEVSGVSSMDLDGPLNMGEKLPLGEKEQQSASDPTKEWRNAVDNLVEAIKSQDGPGTQHLFSTVLSESILSVAEVEPLR